MAMGGGSSKGGGGGGGHHHNRGRPYGMMLLLAFGAAVFGVMVLHKFRERRIFNLVIQDKDRHILTLHLHLQKEREATKEAKRKVQELKAKTYSLRTQKMELNNKLLEMQSITSSLKEEHKELESALEEKQNQIKRLREKKIDSNNEKSQLTALTEILKQKEAEIVEMKRQLEKLINVRSVSTDDPSNPPLNLTLNGVSSNVENRASEGEKEDANSKDRLFEESTDQKWENNHGGEGVGQKSEVGEKNAENGQGREEVLGDDKLKKFGNSQDNAEFIGSGDKDNKNTTDVKTNEVLQTKEGGDAGEMGDNEHEKSRDMQPKELEKSQDVEGRALGAVIEDGKNFKMHDRSRNVVVSIVRGVSGHKNVTKGRRRRVITREMGGDFKDDQGNKGANTTEDAAERKGGRVTMRGGGLTGNERTQDREIGLRMGDKAGDQDASVMDQLGEVPEKQNKIFENSKYEENLKGEGKGVVQNEGMQEISKNPLYGEGIKLRTEMGEEKELEGREQEMASRESSDPGDVENIRTEVTNANTNQQLVTDDGFVSKEIPLENSRDSLTEEGLTMSSNSTELTMIQKSDEVIRQEEDQNAKLISENEYSNEGEKDTTAGEEAEDLEVADVDELPEKTEGDDLDNLKLEVEGNP